MSIIPTPIPQLRLLICSFILHPKNGYVNNSNRNKIHTHEGLYLEVFMYVSLIKVSTEFVD